MLTTILWVNLCNQQFLAVQQLDLSANTGFSLIESSGNMSLQQSLIILNGTQYFELRHANTQFFL
jgi:hypothetical protein